MLSGHGLGDACAVARAPSPGAGALRQQVAPLTDRLLEKNCARMISIGWVGRAERAGRRAPGGCAGSEHIVRMRAERFDIILYSLSLIVVAAGVVSILVLW